MKKLLVLSVLLILSAGFVAAACDPDLFFSLGDFLVKNDYCKKAVGAYNKGLSIDPSDKVALHNLGVAYHCAGDYKKAEKSFYHAIELDPSYSKAYYSLGLLLFERQDYVNANDAFSHLVVLDSSNANAHFDYAVSLVAEYRSGNEDRTLLLTAYDEFMQADQLGNIAHAKENAEIVKENLV